MNGQPNPQHYSRRMQIGFASELQRGDLVDMSTTMDPSWVPVARIGACADDADADDYCGDPEGCEAVIFFDDPDCPLWHVTEADEIHARLLADADEDTVRAENAAHDAATRMALDADEDVAC